MNTRKAGYENRIKILKFIAIAGYATTRQLAKAVLGEVTASSIRSLSRTLRSMRDEKLILCDRLNDSISSEQIQCLASGGAEWLSGEIGTEFKNTRALMRSAHSHRTACNSVFAAIVDNDYMNDERTVFSELDIRNETASLFRLKYHDGERDTYKIPDVLVDLPDYYEWYEIENNWRSDDDLNKMVWCLRRMRLNGGFRVIFVVTAKSAKTIKQRVKAKLLHERDVNVSKERLIKDLEIWENIVSFKELDTESMTLRDI